MEEKKETCPCAAVAELKIMVELLTKKVENNESRLKVGEDKLNNDYTRLEVITMQISNVANTMEKIQEQIVELVEERRKKEQAQETDLKRRVHDITDEVIKWGVLLLLSFVAVKLGFSGGVL